MSVKPRTLLEKIQWFESHVAPWNTNAVAIGTTVVEATAFQTKTEAARAALTAADEAREASKNASLALQNAVAAADVAASGIIQQVRAKAETTHNPGVYVLASIPAPATPTPVGELTKPGNFMAELDEIGAVKLLWKCAQPKSATGVTYQVWRRIGDVGEFTCLGGTGAKFFNDATIPAGSAAVTYRLQATRSTSSSPWAQFVVSFGSAPSGMTIASVMETSAKMAA